MLGISFCSLNLFWGIKGFDILVNLLEASLEISLLQLFFGFFIDFFYGVIEAVEIVEFIGSCRVI
jgi:hypothetical protein